MIGDYKFTIENIFESKNDPQRHPSEKWAAVIPGVMNLIGDHLKGIRLYCSVNNTF